MRTNSQIVKFTYLQCSSAGYSIFMELWNCLLNIKTFSSPPKRNIVPISHHYPFLPNHSQAKETLMILSGWICLFFINHINGIIQYVVFCDWLLSLAIVFSKIIHLSNYYFISFYYKISPVSKQLKEWYDEYPHMHHFIVSLIVLILSMYTCICIFHLLIDWLYHLKVAYKSFHLSPTKFKHLSPEKMTYFLDEQVLFDT